MKIRTYIHKKRTYYKTILFLIVYLNILLTFTVIFIVLDLLGLGSIVDHYSSLNHQEQYLDKITRSLYFSAITLFSVGYGDITPFGWSRAFSLIEAMIGYLLPVVIVIQFIPMQNSEKHETGKKEDSLM